MRNNTEIPVSVLDASRTETTTPEASAATDADQSGEADSASTTTQPDSNEDSGTDSEEMHMESTPAPEAAQSQDQVHAPLAMDASLPAAGNQDTRQSQIVNSESTDADQPGETASAGTTTQPDSNEDSGTDSEEMHMESTPAPEAAQSQDQEHAPLATAVSLPAADNQDSSQAQIVKSEKKSTALTPKRSHKKKKANPLSRAQVADMAASEACPAATPSTFAFGMQGSAEETRGQFVYPHTDLGNCPDVLPPFQ